MSLSRAKRKFTGIWISKDIIECDDLNTIDKMLYAEIEHFDDEGKGVCWASNEYFSKLLTVSQSTIKRSVKKLTDLDLINCKIIDGYRRWITLGGVGQNDLGVGQNDLGVGQNDLPTHYKGDNNKENKENAAASQPEFLSCENGFETDFEEWWQYVPKKEGKPAAKKAYLSRRKEGISKQILIDAIKAYAKKCSLEGTEKSFIKNPQGWLNKDEQRWLSDYTSIPQRPVAEIKTNVSKQTSADADFQNRLFAAGAEQAKVARKYRTTEEIIVEEKRFAEEKADRENDLNKAFGLKPRENQLREQRQQKDWSAISGLPINHEKLKDLVKRA